MCDPVTLAAISVGIGAVSTGMSAYGSAKGAAAQKDQAQMSQAQAEMQAQLANYNAQQIEAYGKINSDMVKTVAGLNNQITDVTANTNIALVNATTDFNVGVIGATAKFNEAAAKGAGDIITAEGDAEAAAHKANAGVLEIAAQDALTQGNQAETQSRTAYSLVKGRQRAALAANGVDLGEGSALRMQADTDYASDVDASTIKANALKAALGYRVAGANEMTASTMATLNAKGQALDKYAEGVAAKINGATDVANATMTGNIKALDEKMTASFQILNTTIGANVQSMNIDQQTTQQAWNARASALGYQAQGAAYGQQASSISPFLVGATSLLSGASQVASNWYQFSKAGASPSAQKKAA